MTDLIATLEGLTSPDREVDAHIHALAIGGRVHFVDKDQAVIERPIDGFWIRGIYPLKGRKIPRYTASLDAITALVERVLPGWQWAAWGGAIEAGSTKPRCMAHVSNGFSQWTADDCPTPAIALCIALLRALEARDGTE